MLVTLNFKHYLIKLNKNFKNEAAVVMLQNLTASFAYHLFKI